MAIGEEIEFIDFSLNNRNIFIKLKSGKFLAQDLTNFSNHK